MNWYRNLKIQSKLFLIFGTLILLISAFTAVAVVPKFRISIQYNTLINSHIKRQTHIDNAIGDMNRIRFTDIIKGYQAERANSMDEFSDIYKEYEAFAKSFNQSIGAYCDLLLADGGMPETEMRERLDIVNKINILFAEYQESINTLNECMYNRQTEMAFDCILKLVPLGDALGDALEQLRNKAFLYVEQKSMETMAFAGRVSNVMIFIAAFIIFISIIVSVFMTKNIRLPIAEMERAMAEISKGNLNYPIRSKFSDELGTLSNHIGDMIETISEMNKTMVVMDYLDTMIYIADLDYNLLYVNHRLTDTFKIGRDTCIMQKCYKVIRNLNNPCPFCPLRKLLPNRGSLPSLNYACIWDESINAWLGCRTAVIRWIDGTMAHFHSLTDETLKKTHEEQLREADEHTQLMLDALPMCCQLWNRNFQIIACNEEMVRHYGVSCKEEYLKRFHEFSPEYQPCGISSREMTLELIRKAFKEGFCQFEWTHKNLKGELIPSEITLVRVKYKGDYAVAGYTRDLREFKTMISEMRAAEQDLRLARDAAQAANQAKSSFLANMSHEIRTPMNSIIGFSELALDSDVPPKTRGYLANILENSEWLLQIINDILDLSKIESGKLELEHIPFSLHEIFTHCQTTIMPKAMEKGIIMHFYAEPPAGQKLLGDPTRLRQVMINLLSNAVKFTHAGAIKVSASINETGKNHVTIHFAVADSGIGMTPEQVDKVCEPFTQADTSTTRKFGGTGLGLPITKNIVELMGGKLSVVSTPGLGSKFSFDLSFEVIDEADAIPHQKTLVTPIEKPLFSGDVLICEDNLMNQRVITDHLTRVGLQPTTAMNGKEGVDTVFKRMEDGKKPFDLIFMDIHMPVMDGLEASSEIVKLNTGVPIVALTANIMAEDRELYRLNGIKDYLGKPFTSYELWHCLLKYFKPLPSTVNEKRQIYTDEELNIQLLTDFVKDNQTTFNDITNALENNDIKLAHRLAHTLKSNAALITEPKLRQAATEVEQLLKNGENKVPAICLDVLKTELDIVLKELSPLLSEKKPPNKTTSFDKEKMIELLGRLEPLLKSGNPECVQLAKDLWGVPEAEKLIEQIEDYDFKPALATLTALKNETDKKI